MDMELAKMCALIRPMRCQYQKVFSVHNDILYTVHLFPSVR